MGKATNDQFIQGTLSSEDYLLRTLGTLVHSPEVALLELVANAWDAGATTVDITIPDEYGHRNVEAKGLIWEVMPRLQHTLAKPGNLSPQVSQNIFYAYSPKKSQNACHQTQEFDMWIVK